MREKNLIQVLKKLGGREFRSTNKGVATNCPLSYIHANQLDTNPSFFAHFTEPKSGNVSWGMCHACQSRGNISEFAEKRMSHFNNDQEGVLTDIFKAEWSDEEFCLDDYMVKYSDIPNFAKGKARPSKKKFQASYLILDNQDEICLVMNGEDVSIQLSDMFNMANQWIGIDHPYWRERGITVEDLQTYKLGYAEKLVFKKFKNGNWYYSDFGHRVIFAVLNEEGSIVGWSGRVVDKEKIFNKGELNNLQLYTSYGSPKYYHAPSFNKTDFLYGEHLWNDKRISGKRVLVLCEGFMDAINIHKATKMNFGATMGGDLSDAQIEKIKKRFDFVVQFPDNDAEGERIKEIVKEKLVKHNIPRSEVDFNSVNQKDAGEMPLDLIKSLIFDCMTKG